MDFNGHQSLSHARNFALRARGLPRTSASPAVTTFFVSTTARNGRRAKFLLYDPIFKRVKRNHDHTAAGADGSYGGIDKLLQALELIVDKNPQRLKRTRRRMNLTVTRPAGNAFDRGNEIRRAVKRTGAHDRAAIGRERRSSPYK